MYITMRHLLTEFYKPMGISGTLREALLALEIYGNIADEK
jgi:hypothetical protein